ncbi:hypothetical protein [Erythrobacter sp. A6_0]|uniref:hypothetical protein n=1 Tax=Erythrobacter sp. A6_0 TaxID=2821089 RepID=UPI001ADCF2A8|nr:hypothetical protein [Erythrobacter sp. A6_0]MBO9511675.1 hypothetical protein [Erythrobacter sp. A6_0]
MGQPDDTTTMPMRATRSGVSRKMLTRKALNQRLPDGEPLEASFPSAKNVTTEQSADPFSAPTSAPATALAQQPLVQAEWLSEDETAFQTLLARRKAAGYQRRGRDLSDQVLKPGEIKPNPDTIVATIVALVTERGELMRCELLTAMATATFPHPRAKPADASWCQGYVAGAIRNGFLAVAPPPPVDAEQEG